MLHFIKKREFIYWLIIYQFQILTDMPPFSKRQLPYPGRARHLTRCSIIERSAYVSCQRIAGRLSQDVRQMNIECYFRTFSFGGRYSPVLVADRRRSGLRPKGGNPMRAGSALIMRHCAAPSDAAAENPGLCPKIRF